MHGTLDGLGAPGSHGPNAFYQLFVSDTPMSCDFDGLSCNGSLAIPMVEAINGSRTLTAALPFTYGKTFYLASFLGAEVLGDWAAAAAFGGEDPGSLIETRHAGTEADGLSRLTFAGGSILVPALAFASGERVRLLVHARDVMIALGPPEGLSALNVLAARVVSVTPLDGAACEVRLDCGGTALTARITRRSAKALGLVPGSACHAILKSVALAQD